MNESSHANDQDAKTSPPTENVVQPKQTPEPDISGSDYEFAEPQLGVAEISEDVAQSVDLEAAEAEAARVGHEAELVSKGVSTPFTESAAAPASEEAVSPEEPIDWDSAETIMRTDFTKPPVATNPWSSATVAPAAPDLPPAPPVVPESAAQESAAQEPEQVPSETPQEQPVTDQNAQEQHDGVAAAPAPEPPTAPEAPSAPEAPVSPVIPPAPAVAPQAANDHGWRRPETPWQQSATPWKPKAGQWQSPAQIARGHEETAAAAALAAESLAAEQATVPIERHPDSAPTSTSPQVNAAGSEPQSPGTQAPYGDPAPLGQTNTSGQPATAGQSPYGAQAQQGAQSWGAPAQFGSPGIPPVPGAGGPQGPGGGGMSASAKKKLFIILGAAVLGLGLLVFFIWLLVGFILGNVKNLDPNPGSVVSSQSQASESQAAEPSAEQDPEASAVAEGAPDYGLILAALSPLDWLEGDCL